MPECECGGRCSSLPAHREAKAADLPESMREADQAIELDLRNAPRIHCLCLRLLLYALDVRSQQTEGRGDAQEGGRHRSRFGCGRYCPHLTGTGLLWVRPTGQRACVRSRKRCDRTLSAAGPSTSTSRSLPARKSSAGHNLSPSLGIRPRLLEHGDVRAGRPSKGRRSPGRRCELWRGHQLGARASCPPWYRTLSGLRAGRLRSQECRLSRHSAAKAQVCQRAVSCCRKSTRKRSMYCYLQNCCPRATIFYATLATRFHCPISTLAGIANYFARV
jgi:hypothetical protein